MISADPKTAWGFWRIGYAWAFLATALAGLAMGTLVDMEPGNETTWDYAVESWVISVRPSHPLVTQVAMVVTRLGNLSFTGPALGAIVVGLVVLRKRGWTRIDAEEAPFWLVVSVGGQVLNWGLKLWFQRLRPNPVGRLVEVDFYSFPSGHGMFAGVSLMLAGFVMVRVWREHSRTRIVAGIVLAACLTLSVAASRVWLSVHYASDVAAGFALGVLWSTLCHAARFGWPWTPRNSPGAA